MNIFTDAKMATAASTIAKIRSFIIVPLRDEMAQCRLLVCPAAVIYAGKPW